MTQYYTYKSHSKNLSNAGGAMVGKEERSMSKIKSATHITAATLGILVGLAGIDHGIFEILQGNIATGSTMIAAIGPEQRFWEYGLETAFTIVPNFLTTGILAVVFGILVTIWSAFFLHRRYGAGILMVLSIILFLVGGGFAPIFMALIASLTATRINRPLKWPPRLLPGGVLKFLSKIWLGSLILFVAMFLINVEIAIFGWPLTTFFDADTSSELLYQSSYWMLALMFLSVITGLARDSMDTRDLSPGQVYE